MGHVFTFNDAKIYEAWSESSAGRASLQKENQLMLEILNPLSGRSVLDVGCGMGGNLLALKNSGLSITGLDASPYMLDKARGVLGNSADLHRGVAEDLPFEDSSFHYVVISKTLEFVDNPKTAVAEACRVAKDRVFIGIMNRRTIKKTGQELKSRLGESFFEKAIPISLKKLKETLYGILGEVPVSWRSLYDIPKGFEKILIYAEEAALLQRCPFRSYTGVVITPIPRFKTRPLNIPCTANPRPGGVIG